MRRMLMVMMMYQAMLMCVADVSIMPSMDLPSSTIEAKYLVVDAQGNVLEQNDYYPYGGLFDESTSLQNYKYSGKVIAKINE